MGKHEEFFRSMTRGITHGTILAILLCVPFVAGVVFIKYLSRISGYVPELLGLKAAAIVFGWFTCFGIIAAIFANEERPRRTARTAMLITSLFGMGSSKAFGGWTTSHVPDDISADGRIRYNYVKYRINAFHFAIVAVAFGFAVYYCARMGEIEGYKIFQVYDRSPNSLCGTSAVPIGALSWDRIVWYVADLTVRGLLFDVMEHFHLCMGDLKTNVTELWFATFAFIYRFFCSLTLAKVFIIPIVDYFNDDLPNPSVSFAQDVKPSQDIVPRTPQSRPTSLRPNTDKAGVAEDQASSAGHGALTGPDSVDVQMRAIRSIKALGLPVAFNAAIQQEDIEVGELIFERLKALGNENVSAHSAGLLANHGSMKAFEYLEKEVLPRIKHIRTESHRQVVNGYVTAAAMHDQEQRALDFLSNNIQQLVMDRVIKIEEPWYFNQVSRLYASMDDYASALSALERVIEKVPNDASYLYNRAICLYKLNRPEEGLAMVRAFLKLPVGGDSGLDADHMAFAYKRLQAAGEMAEAESVLKRMEGHAELKMRALALRQGWEGTEL